MSSNVELTSSPPKQSCKLVDLYLKSSWSNLEIKICDIVLKKFLCESVFIVKLPFLKRILTGFNMLKYWAAITAATILSFYPVFLSRQQTLKLILIGLEIKVPNNIKIIVF